MLVKFLQNQHLHIYYQNHDRELLTPWPHQLNAEDAWSPEILQKEGQDVWFCFFIFEELEQELGGLRF